MNRRELLRGGIIGGAATAISAVPVLGQLAEQDVAEKVRSFNSDGFLPEYLIQQDELETIMLDLHTKPLPNQVNWEELLTHIPNAFTYIKNPDYELTKIAVSRCGYLIRDVKIQTEELQLLAINAPVPADYSFFIDPSYKVKLESVTKFGNWIGVVGNPTEELLLASLTTYHPSNPFAAYRDIFANCSDAVTKRAIEVYPENISLIKDPSPELQMIAIKGNPSTFQYLQNPAEEVFKYMLEDKDRIRKLENMCDKIVVPFTIQQMLVDQGRERILSIMDNRGVELSPEATEYLLKNNYCYRQNFMYKNKKNINDLLFCQQIIFCQDNSYYLENIENPSEELQLWAFKRYNRRALKLLKVHCEALQIAAVNERFSNFNYIKNPLPILEKIMREKYEAKLAKQFSKTTESV